jgi:hypothetical protein
MHDIPEVAAKPDGRPDNEPERGAAGGDQTAATCVRAWRRKPATMSARSFLMKGSPPREYAPEDAFQFILDGSQNGQI